MAGKTEIRDTYAETWSFSSEGVISYPLGKKLCVVLRAFGVTPNMITLFNVLNGAGAARAMATADWWSLAPHVFLYQLLDATDGTMARTFGMGSTFGAKLDEFTDICFGASLTISALLCIWPNQYAVAFQIVYSAALLLGAVRYGELRHDPSKPKVLYLEDLGFWEWLGLWGVENMGYMMWFNAMVLWWFRDTDEQNGVEHFDLSSLELKDWTGGSVDLAIPHPTFFGPVLIGCVGVFFASFHRESGSPILGSPKKGSPGGFGHFGQPSREKAAKHGVLPVKANGKNGKSRSKSPAKANGTKKSKARSPSPKKKKK